MESKDLNALLRWSITHSNNEVSKLDSEAPKFGKRSEEDMKFLEAAFVQAFGSGIKPYEIVDKSKKKLIESNNEDELIDAVEQLINVLDIEPEFARNIEKCNLVEVLFKIINSKSLKLKCVCSDFLALVLPNNPQVQEAFHRIGLLEFLLNEIKQILQDQNNVKINSDYMYYTKKICSMVNGIVINHNLIENNFKELGGLQLISQLSVFDDYSINTKLETLKNYFSLNENSIQNKDNKLLLA